MVNIKNAIEFVKSYGSQIEQARLDSILLGTPAPVTIQQELTKLQNPDGGYSYWIKGCSTVYDTVHILTWLDDLKIQNGPLVDSAFNFLIKNLKPDGGWDEVEDIKNADPPPFLMPGEINTRIRITAYCAHWLMRFERGGEGGIKEKNTEFLKSYIKPSGLLIDNLQPTWDVLVLFSYSPGMDSLLFKETLRIIEKNYAPQKWSGSYLAYLLCCLRDSGLHSSHPFVDRCLKELTDKQLSDGSWNSRYGEGHSADAIVETLRVLKHFEVV